MTYDEQKPKPEHAGEKKDLDWVGMLLPGLGIMGAVTALMSSLDRFKRQAEQPHLARVSITVSFPGSEICRAVTIDMGATALDKAGRVGFDACHALAARLVNVVDQFEAEQELRDAAADAEKPPEPVAP